MKADPTSEAAPPRARRKPRSSPPARRSAGRTEVAPRERLAPERMSRVDTAWLRMDSDVNLMMIVGVWLLEAKVSHAALSRRIVETLVQYERCRQHLQREAAGG